MSKIAVIECQQEELRKRRQEIDEQLDVLQGQGLIAVRELQELSKKIREI